MPKSVATFLANVIPFLLFVIVSYPVWIIEKNQLTSSRLKRFVVWFITTMLLPGIMSFTLTNINEAIWEPIQEAIVNFLMGAEESPDPNTELGAEEPPDPNTELGAEEPPDSNTEFEQNVYILSNEEIQYTSSLYEIKIILPTRYECKSYTLPSGNNSEEEFELYYDEMQLNINIIIADSPYQLFESIEEYYAYYKQIHVNKPNIYCPLYEKGTPPYCVFPFNFDDGKEIYYELTYNLNGICCITKFTYPTNNRAICNSIIEEYVKTAVLQNN